MATFDQVSALKPFKTMWRIRVKIIRLWKQYSARTGVSIEMVLVDSSVSNVITLIILHLTLLYVYGFTSLFETFVFFLNNLLCRVIRYMLPSKMIWCTIWKKYSTKGAQKYWLILMFLTHVDHIDQPIMPIRLIFYPWPVFALAEICLYDWLVSSQCSLGKSWMVVLIPTFWLVSYLFPSRSLFNKNILPPTLNDMFYIVA